MDITHLFEQVLASEQETFSALPKLSWKQICEEKTIEQSGHCHSTSILGDRVCVGEGTVIDPFVVIEDNVIIGKNVRIRSGALIRSHTIIGDDCVIGHGAEIKHAFIRDGAKIQGHSFVGDSIIGRGTRIGTGVVIGNRRFDQQEIAWQTEQGPAPSGSDKLGALIGDYVRLGANVTMNPGAVIGAYTWITGGQAVGGYIPPKKFVKGNGEVVENGRSGFLKNVDQEGST